MAIGDGDTAEAKNTTTTSPLEEDGTTRKGKEQMRGPGGRNDDGEDNYNHDDGGYIRTAARNYVSREATIHGPRNVELRGKCVVRPHAVVHGDLPGAPVRVGRYVTVGRGTVLRPPPRADGDVDDAEKGGKGKHVPMMVGSHTSMGSNCTVEAAAIGSSVRVGNGVTLGRRCIIKDCVIVEDGTAVPPDMVVPPFSRVAGRPGRVLVGDDVPESAAVDFVEDATERYNDFDAWVRDREEGAGGGVEGD